MYYLKIFLAHPETGQELGPPLAILLAKLVLGHNSTSSLCMDTFLGEMSIRPSKKQESGQVYDMFANYFYFYLLLFPTNLNNTDET